MSIQRSLLILLTLTLSTSGCGPAGAPDSAPRPPQTLTVRAAKARIGDLSLPLEALGTVTAFNTTTVKTRVSGELRRIQFKEGAKIRAGELLAEIDPRAFQNRLDQALGKLAGDRAQLQFAEAELLRDRQLIDKGYIARSQLETQHAEVSRLKGVIASDQADIETARLDLSYARITAPIDGQLGLKRVDVGNVLNALDPLVVITQIQPIQVVFNIPQDETRRLKARLGDQELVVEAYDREGTHLLGRGRVMSVDNLIDLETGTLRIKAEFANEDLALYPNQFVNVRLIIETLKDQILVPRHAIATGANKESRVFVIREDQTIKVQPVIPGPSAGEETVILSGVGEGERLVTEGLDKLKEGTRVSVQEETAPPVTGP